MAYGLQLSSALGNRLITTETYNMHYLGRATHFQTLRIQSHPPSQYDNFYITSETAPMPFIVQRPGIHAAILGVQRDANNSSIWNITVLSSQITPNYRYPANDVAWDYWPLIKRYGDSINYAPAQYIGSTTAAYWFSLVNDPPPQVLCFAKLPSFAGLANQNSYGMAIYEPGGAGIAFDSGRYPLDPSFTGDVTIPTPVFAASRDALASPYVEGFVFQKRLDLGGADSGRHVAFTLNFPTGSADTYIGAQPAQPAMFFSSRAECFAHMDYGEIGESCVPVASIINGHTVHVEWGVRGAVVEPAENVWATNVAWIKGEASTPIMIVDAARYP